MREWSPGPLIHVPRQVDGEVEAAQLFHPHHLGHWNQVWTSSASMAVVVTYMSRNQTQVACMVEKESTTEPASPQYTSNNYDLKSSSQWAEFTLPTYSFQVGGLKRVRSLQPMTFQSLGQGGNHSKSLLHQYCYSAYWKQSPVCATWAWRWAVVTAFCTGPCPVSEIISTHIINAHIDSALAMSSWLC